VTADIIRVLLVDDNSELNSLMKEFLEGHGFSVGSANDGHSGLREALAGSYDMVVLDVMMPAMDGFEVLRRLRLESQVPVLMLTARTEGSSRIRGLEGGADDYLPKPFEPLELVARIRAILRRTRPATSGGPLEVSGVRLDPSSRRVQVAGAPIDVTTVEYDILEVLMRAAGRVVSRDELMQRLYQRPSTPFDRSIDVHISHLRKKLEGPRELIRTVRGVGYQFAIEQPEPQAG
jgi:two-component system, OmpR family, response regulator CpxR